MTELSNLLVISIGLGTVFVGLICIILLCYIMSALCRVFGKKAPAEPKAAAVPAASPAPVENKQEIIAASCAVIAEELGTEANNIKVLSFKRV